VKNATIARAFSVSALIGVAVCTVLYGRYLLFDSLTGVAPLQLAASFCLRVSGG
jgi:hypothetical protein